MENTKKILEEIEKTEKWDSGSLQKILRRYPKEGNRMYAKDELVPAYNLLGRESKRIEERIRMKPTRTISGVATVTVLTKPYPCPGKCIYCPNDPCMPKSYISSEPGAQRALMNKFDPYAQVYNRLVALKNIGHNIQKVELIILGGTWNFYVDDYQLSFIYECYRALNDARKDTMGQVQPRNRSLNKITWEELEKEQKKNELAYCRNVGLVVETRPDYITEEEAIRMRRLGCTKVQIGIQSLSDTILKKNSIGRMTKDTKKAFEILRRMGFKIHGHWMPSLYGSSVRRDISDYRKLWGRNFCPDELKIYPVSVMEGTPLHQLYLEGKYIPYNNDELTYVLKKVLPLTPRYCRLTRIIRDIPSNEIVAGSKRTNLRQIVEEELKEEGIVVEDIRSREIREEDIELEKLELEEICYMTSTSKEVFLSYRTKDTDRICAFLRLSIPKGRYRRKHFLKELEGLAIIREVHVYGKVVGIKERGSGESQHLGLGSRLIERAESIARDNGFNGISVISAIGTREYYRDRGFKERELYMKKLF
jgi:elongator complex protein 3